MQPNEKQKIEISPEEKKVYDKIVNSFFSDIDDSRIANMGLIALRNTFNKLEKWIQSFRGIFPCFFCGSRYHSEDIGICESIPDLIKENKLIKISKRVILICKNCDVILQKLLDSKKFENEKDFLKEWNTMKIFPWQIEFIEKHIRALLEEEKKSLDRFGAIEIIEKWISENESWRTKI